MRTIGSVLLGATALLCTMAWGAGPATGDLRVCRLGSMVQVERVGNEVGLAVGTTGWNPGQLGLDWYARDDARHPFIAQSFYKLVDGRLLQIGIAGVKHGFYVASASGCGGEQCTREDGHVLHRNCSDTYTSSNNSSQMHMGPRFEINPWTAAWNYQTSHLTPPHTDAPLDHLLRVQDSDLQRTLGANTDVKYFIEAYYIHYQNANPTTAVAWKRVDIAGQPGMEWEFIAGEEPGASREGFAIASAWPGARLTEIAQASPVVRGVSPDGRALLASRVTPVGGKWRYDYALLNVDMDRQIREFAIPLPGGVNITDVFFHAPKQPNETLNGVGGSATNDTPWSHQQAADTLRWSTVKNPLRWGVMYTFGFTADRVPADGTTVVKLFKPGQPETLQGRAQVPGALESTLPPPPVAANEDFVSKRDILRANAALLANQTPSPASTTATKLFALQAAAADFDINQHGDECTAAIGPIPPFSCLDGSIIPITVDGQELPAGGYTADMSCDRPVQLGLGDDGQCVPYARLGKLPSVNSQGQADPDVKWTFICRRYKLRSNPAYPKFEDVAIIGHRASTGATCFFQTLSGELNLPDGITATRVPPPAERAAQTPAGQLTAKKFWLSPQRTASIGCYECHAADPWIHTPYVDQVKGREEDPTMPLVPDAPRVDETLRYVFVGSQHFNNWPAPEHYEPRNNECVSCHRIGVQRRSLPFTEYAVGLRTADITSMFRSYPYSHWMPPDQSSTMTQAKWESFYKASADQIRSCMLDGSQPACRRRAVNPVNP